VSLAITLAVFHHYYSRYFSPLSILKQSTWQLKHRGYPSQFGYLNHHFDIRTLDIYSEVMINESRVTIASQYSFYGKDSLLGEVQFQLEADWHLDEDHTSTFNVLPESLKIISMSERLESMEVTAFFYELIEESFNFKPKLLSFSERELIVEAPQVGIVRLNRLDHAALLAQD
jgi:hypothetical protein